MLGPNQWKMLIHSAPDFIFVSRTDTFEITEVSKRACEFYGYTRAEFLSMLILDIEVNAPLVGKIRSLYAKTPVGEVFELFGHNRQKNGNIFPAHTRYTKIDDDYAIACVRDISIIEEQANLEVMHNQLITKKTKEIIHDNKLSRRESEVLFLIGKAMSNAQIADKLNISIKTVSTYRTRLLHKLGLKNNTELAQYVVKKAN